MTTTILRGRTLSFHRRPEGPDDTDAFTYRTDGAVVIENGQILSTGDFDDIDIAGQVIDHHPHLILPGFIDPHIHFPQAEVLGAYAGNLLEWLHQHTFPAEARFADPDHAARIATAFFDELLRNGTTTVSAFCTSHRASVEAFFAEAEQRNMAVFGGLTMMDRNAPEAVCQPAQAAYETSLDLLDKWHGRGRARYVITPRFAITSSEEELRFAAQLFAKSDCLLQTHLSENHDEIALVAKLFPTARDYLDVYESFDLINERTLLGHAIHLSDRERARMAETGAVAIHCPTSNLFLGSGLFDPKDLRMGVATDIGGGTSYSMLRTLDEAYKIQQLRGERYHPFMAFYDATLGNARVLQAEDAIGRLTPGSDADIVVLNPAATPAMALRHARVESLAEELFLLQTVGDDRAIVETYVAGNARKPR